MTEKVTRKSVPYVFDEDHFILLLEYSSINTVYIWILFGQYNSSFTHVLDTVFLF